MFLTFDWRFLALHSLHFLKEWIFWNEPIFLLFFKHCKVSCLDIWYPSYLEWTKWWVFFFERQTGHVHANQNTARKTNYKMSAENKLLKRKESCQIWLPVSWKKFVPFHCKIGVLMFVFLLKKNKGDLIILCLLLSNCKITNHSTLMEEKEQMSEGQVLLSHFLCIFKSYF